MKRILPLLALLSLAAVPTGPQQVTLMWDNQPEYGTNTTIRLHHSTSLTLPMASWEVLGTVVDTNAITIAIEPGPHFFYVTASNFWGVTDPSSVALTPPLPQSGKLQIKRGGN